MRVATQSSQYGIGNVSYARLQGKKFFGNRSLTIFLYQKVCYVLSDLACGFVQRSEGGYLVTLVCQHHSSHFLGVYFHADASGTVVYLIDRDFTAVRRIVEHKDVVHSRQFARMSFVQFDNDFVCHTCQGGRNAYRGAQNEVAFRGNAGSFDDSHIDFPQESVAHVLSDLRKVKIEILHLAAIDGIPHFLVRLERSAESNGMRFGQGTVHLVSCCPSGNKSYFKRFSFIV